jgi:hypothetical protein
VEGNHKLNVCPVSGTQLTFGGSMV